MKRLDVRWNPEKGRWTGRFGGRRPLGAKSLASLLAKSRGRGTRDSFPPWRVRLP